MQNAKASRYQPWYSRSPDTAIAPATKTAASPAPGDCDAPPGLNTVLSRTRVPLTHIRPSPNMVPAPPARLAVPWK